LPREALLLSRQLSAALALQPAPMHRAAGRASGAQSQHAPCQKQQQRAVRRWGTLPQTHDCDRHRVAAPLHARAGSRAATSATTLPYSSSTTVRWGPAARWLAPRRSLQLKTWTRAHASPARSSSHQQAPSNWDDDASDDEEQEQVKQAVARLTTLDDGGLAIFISKTTAAKAAARTLVDALSRAPSLQLRGCGHPAAAIAVKTLGLASAWLRPSGRCAAFTISRQEQENSALLGKCYCYHIHVALERADSEQLQGILQKQQEFPVELEQYWRKKDKCAPGPAPGPAPGRALRAFHARLRRLGLRPGAC
jgi:hypothetical protein